MRVVLFFSIILSITSCGIPSNSRFLETEPTEEEYQFFVAEIDKILNSHKQFAIKILHWPILSSDDIAGDPNKYMTEVQRIWGLDFVSNPRKFKSLWPRLWKEKGRDYRDRYLKEFFSVPGAHPGDLLSPLSILKNPVSSALAFFTTEEIHSAAKEIDPYGKDIKWDGVRERYNYKNFEDKLRVVTLASAIFDYAYREDFKDYLESHPEVFKKLRTNTKTSDLKTAYEPLDLIQSMIANQYSGLQFSSVSLSPIYFHKLTHRSLYNYFGKHDSDDLHGAELQDIMVIRTLGSGDTFTALCADGGMTENSFVGEGNMSSPDDFVKYSQYEVFSLIEEHRTELEFLCNGETYALQLKGGEGDPIPLPANYDFDKNRGSDPFKVVIPFALTEEINGKARWVFHRYMNYYGFKFHGEKKNVPTKEAFLHKSMSTDMIIPVAHSLDVNSFHLGTKHSVVAKYTKSFKRKDGTRAPVELDVFFPSKPASGIFERVVVNTDDLADMMHRRRHVKNTPLFIFNNSCFAQNALWTWMKAYRQSAELSIDSGLISSMAELKDVPHIIAPKGGYPTSSTVDVLSNVIFPYVAMKSLAVDSSPKKLFETLAKQDLAKKDPIIVFLRKIQSWRRKESAEETRFNPVYNADYEELFEMNGYRLLLQKEGEQNIIEY